MTSSSKDRARSGSKPIQSLPPRPLTDEALYNLLEQGETAGIVEIYVPEDRIRTVVGNVRGEFEGDILDFWVETENGYSHLYFNIFEWKRDQFFRQDDSSGGPGEEAFLDRYVAVREVVSGG